jgi:hypothetical protein
MDGRVRQQIGSDSGALSPGVPGPDAHRAVNRATRPLLKVDELPV